MSTMRPLQRGGRDVGLDVAAADEVERDVGAAVGCVDDRPARARRRRARRRCDRRHDPGVEAERAAPVELRRACGRCRRRARRARCASCSAGGADAAPDRVDEHPFAGSRRRACVTSASCAVTNASGTPPIVDEVEPVRNRRALRGRHARRTPPGRRRPTMPNTRAPSSTPGDIGAARLDDARELEPGDVGRRSRRRRVVAGPLQEVGAVQPGAVHPHDDLGRRPAPGSGRSTTSIRPSRNGGGAHRARQANRALAPDVPSPSVTGGLRFLDDDGEAVGFDAPDAAALLALLGDLDAATVSACPDCGARVARRGRTRRPARRRRAASPRRRAASTSPTTRRRCTSSSSTRDRVPAPPLARPARGRVARRHRACAGPPARAADDQPSARAASSNEAAMSSMNPSMSVIAAGSMFNRCRARRSSPSVVTFSAAPARGPNG